MDDNVTHPQSESHLFLIDKNIEFSINFLSFKDRVTDDTSFDPLFYCLSKWADFYQKWNLVKQCNFSEGM